MSPTHPLRIGLIGVGKMGGNHLRVLSAMKPVHVEFIHDSKPELAARMAAEYATKPADDLERDLRRVDAVIIASPTSTHLEYIALASRFTSRIFVEKPLTDSLETTRQVAQLAQDKGLRIQVGFIERFNPVIRALVKVVPSDIPVVHADFVRTDRVTDRNLDVDVVLDLMVHDLDLALYLRGPVIKVQALGHEQDGQTALAQAALVHADGTVSRIMASKITEKRIRQISLTCPEMFVEADLLQKALTLHRKTVEQPYAQVSLAAVREAVFVRHEEALLSQLLAFAEYCRGDSCTPLERIPTVQDALAAMELAEQVRSSIAANVTSPAGA